MNQCKAHRKRGAAKLDCRDCVLWLVSHELEMLAIEIMCMRERVASYNEFRGDIRDLCGNRTDSVMARIFNLQDRFTLLNKAIEADDYDLMEYSARRLVGDRGDRTEQANADDVN